MNNITNSCKIIRRKLSIIGIVQGVGFRPFIYRLANSLKLTGYVINTTAGVTCEIQGEPNSIEQFIYTLNHNHPAPSVVEQIKVDELSIEDTSHFDIKNSIESETDNVILLPDQATCQACLDEIRDPLNRRYQYSFTSCALCGPRYSIIIQPPFERDLTAYQKFNMCDQCQTEYNDPSNRRFYAQTNSCPVCGPHLEFWDKQQSHTLTHYDALKQAIIALKAGSIIAVKSIGGFQLLALATDEKVIAKLRKRKNRPHKPFAIMLPDVASAKRYCVISPQEVVYLCSPQAPIVLLNKKIQNASIIADLVAPNVPCYGIMLAYTPLHHLLLQGVGQPLIATSGNLSGDALCFDNQQAITQLKGVADFFLVHNRDIINPCDDSVLQCIKNQAMMLRRARGYCSLPISIKADFNTHILLATGSHLKNTVALFHHNKAYISPYIGDLNSVSTLKACHKNINTLVKHQIVSPTHVMCDQHPDYTSTKIAENMQLPVLKVQHHYAHVLACMAEHHLEPPVLGVAWDGVGYGLDHSLWGGEFLAITAHGFERIAHLKPFPLLGAIQAIKQPKRVALGLLYTLLGEQCFTKLAWVESVFTEQECLNFKKMLQKNINTPQCSSMGRFLEGLAALLDICYINSFEGQAAIALEGYARQGQPSRYYDIPIFKQNNCDIIDWQPMLQQILRDLNQNCNKSMIAASIHNTMAMSIATVTKLRNYQHIVLTGGVFQNKCLLEKSISLIEQAGIRVYWPQKIPPNDGGISLGQLMAGNIQLKHDACVNTLEVC